MHLNQGVDPGHRQTSAIHWAEWIMNVNENCNISAYQGSKYTAAACILKLDFPSIPDAFF